MIKYRINITYCNNNKQFGIDAFCDKKLIKSVPSITECRKDIAELVSMCNELEVELCHIDDIIEDYLTDFCI